MGCGCEKDKHLVQQKLQQVAERRRLARLGREAALRGPKTVNEKKPRPTMIDREMVEKHMKERQEQLALLFGTKEDMA